MLHAHDPTLIYDPVFHTYVDVRSARGQRLHGIYSRLRAAQHAPHGQKRGADRRNAHGPTATPSKRR